jgi:hypothetical protein
MKRLILSLLLLGGLVALSTPAANAVVCARGIYRAGCVAAGPRGAVAVRGGVVGRRAVVVRRRVY